MVHTNPIINEDSPAKTGTLTIANGTVLKMYPNRPIVRECQVREKYSQEEKTERRLFVENAHFLLAHKEEIFADSRMFLAPCRGFGSVFVSRYQPLGAMLEFWSNTEGSVVFDTENHPQLVFCLCGSPMTGSNSSGAISEDGKEHTVSLKDFTTLLRRFGSVLGRYKEYADACLTYSLAEVIALLRDKDKNPELRSVVLSASLLRTRAKHLQERCDELVKEVGNLNSVIADLHTELHWKELLPLYLDYAQHVKEAQEILDALKERRKLMKAAFKAGEFSNNEYSVKVMQLNREENNAAIWNIDIDFKVLIQEQFPDLPISIHSICRFFETHPQYVTLNTDKA